MLRICYPSRSPHSLVICSWELPLCDWAKNGVVQGTCWRYHQET
jgi:hypothetical protein